MVKTTERLRRLEKATGKGTMVSNGRALQFCGDPCAEIYRCSAGGNLLILLADGSLMPCRRLPVIIGNIRDGSLRESDLPTVQEKTGLPADLLNNFYKNC